MRPFDTIVISDLHLGARNARHNELLAFLDYVETDHLILNGDVFEDSRLRGLKEADIAVVDALRRYNDHTEVTWLGGNHDPEPSWFAGLLGIDAAAEVVVTAGGRSYLVCHGHQWDGSLRWPQWIIDAAELVYRGCQMLDRSHRLARLLKRGSKSFVRAVAILQRHAGETGRRRGLDGVILGHTHVVDDTRVHGIHYLNSGCWTENPSAFVGIRDGEVRAYRWLAGEIVPLIATPAAPPQRRDFDEAEWETELLPTG